MCIDVFIYLTCSKIMILFLNGPYALLSQSHNFHHQSLIL